MKNDHALDYLTNSIKKGQKRPRKPTKAQVNSQMKKYLCNQDNWKMNQLKGKSYDEVRLLYYTAYRKDKVFVPMGSEEDY